jgi:hypothetical protein
MLVICIKLEVLFISLGILLRQLMGKIVLERFKVKFSVIIGWKLNGCNMLCSTAL